MLIEIFKAVIITSCVGGALSLILLLMKPLTERFLGAKWQFYMWILVFAVLVCPIKVENTVKLPDALNSGIRQISAKKVEMPSVFQDYSGVYVTATQNEEIDVTGAVAVVWIAIAILLFTKKVIENHLIKRKLYASSKDKGFLDKAQLRETKMVGAPVLMGFFRPVLYVPQGVAESEKMEYIIAHEWVHIHRGDIAVKWFAAAVKCIHWFNPMAFVVAKQLNQACEISCDVEASKGMTQEQKTMYMQIILEISQNDVAFRKSLLALGLSAEGRCLKKRFVAIKKSGTPKLFIRCLGVVFAVSLTLTVVCVGGIIRGNAFCEAVPKEYVPIMKAETVPEVPETVVVVQEESPTVEPEEAVETVIPDTEEEPLPEVVEEKEVKTIRGEFNSEGGDTRVINGVVANEQGCITLEIHSNTQETVDVYINDAQSGKCVFGMEIPVPYETAYVLESLEAGKTYNIVLKGTMRNDWNIESEYVIY